MFFDSEGGEWNVLVLYSAAAAVESEGGQCERSCDVFLQIKLLFNDVRCQKINMPFCSVQCVVNKSWCMSRNTHIMIHTSVRGHLTRGMKSNQNQDRSRRRGVVFKKSHKGEIRASLRLGSFSLTHGSQSEREMKQSLVMFQKLEENFQTASVSETLILCSFFFDELSFIDAHIRPH